MRWFVLSLAIFVLLSGAKAQDEPFPPPRAIEALATSPTEIRLYWLPTPGATGYRVLRDGQDIARLLAFETAYDDKNLAPSSLHTYVVQSLHDGPGSPFSPPYTERTFAAFPTPNTQHLTPNTAFDVVIAQASSGGVAAAIEAGRRGLKVALIEPTTRIGGMPVNGLSASDLRRDANQSGFFVRFRQKVTALYKAEGVAADGRKYEPRIAHQAMKELLYATPNITLYRRTRLARVKTRASATDPNRRRVESVMVEELDANGSPTGRKAELKAKVFVDATDCGDLAAWAGAPFRVGREPRSKREPHNGVIYYDRKTQQALDGSTGEGDRRIQSYAYLLTVKDYGAGADKTLPMPPCRRGNLHGRLPTEPCPTASLNSTSTPKATTCRPSTTPIPPRTTSHERKSKRNIRRGFCATSTSSRLNTA